MIKEIVIVKHLIFVLLVFYENFIGSTIIEDIHNHNERKLLNISIRDEY